MIGHSVVTSSELSFPWHCRVNEISTRSTNIQTLTGIPVVSASKLGNKGATGTPSCLEGMFKWYMKVGIKVHLFWSRHRCNDGHASRPRAMSFHRVQNTRKGVGSNYVSK